jgi:hypothetical protein
MYGEKDQNLLAVAYRQILNEGLSDEGARRKPLLIFLKQVNGFSGPIKEKYRDLWAHLQSLKGVSDIQSETHENGLVSALIQIAQDPLSDTSDHTAGDNLKEQIVGFLKRYYPGREKEVEPQGSKGSLGGASVRY